MPQLHLAPTQSTVDTIRRLAQKEGISVNAYLVPFLNDIAEGRLVRVPHYPAPQREQSKAA
ncbi:hypothetical protein GCM10023185_31080 [Hymenobacter saemangeumensis]|uniref:Toxin-antitoxin system HicB family antitoxin n=1 Tax=Hymenobacter saemangeumensis TaxID=1084522 RepID=A0ABP8ILW0_9BACT